MITSNSKDVLKMIQETVQETLVSGATVGLFEKGEWQFQYFGNLGMISPYNEQILKGSEMYDLASLTKVVGTTTRILQLMDEHKISLDTRVNQILPDYPWLKMTIESLLLHQGGLPADYPKERIFDTIHIQKFFKEYQIPTNVVTVYSDLGYLILGWIIEQIDGTDIDSSEKEHIFLPLGMEHTGYFPSSDSVFVPTEVTIERGIIVGEVHDSKAYHFPRPIGSAGLFSNIEDLSLFCEAILFNKMGTKPLFSYEIYQKLFQLNISGRTFGWEKLLSSQVLYHTGFTGTALGLDKQTEKALILLTNRVHPTREDRGFLRKRIEIYRKFFEV